MAVDSQAPNTGQDGQPRVDSRLAHVLETIRTRRVTRYFNNNPISREHIELTLESARWAPAGGRRRLNVYVVVQDSRMIAKLRAVSPGMLPPPPPALIVVCLDVGKAEALGFRYQEHASAYVDIGTAVQNMLLTAHALGLGSGPVMSFHRRAVQLLLDLPRGIVPEVIVKLGEPALMVKPRVPLVDVNEFTHWERYGGR